MKCKNTIAMVLAGAMLLPSNAFAADLSQYRDFPNDWSAKSLEQAIDDGLLNGSNGMIDAKGLLTRAQMAAIVSRAFGAAKTASLDDYRDVLPSAWYYSDMGKAVKMGVSGREWPAEPGCTDHPRGGVHRSGARLCARGRRQRHAEGLC